MSPAGVIHLSSKEDDDELTQLTVVVSAKGTPEKLLFRPRPLPDFQRPRRAEGVRRLHVIGPLPPSGVGPDGEDLTSDQSGQLVL